MEPIEGVVMRKRCFESELYTWTKRKFFNLYASDTIEQVLDITESYEDFFFAHQKMLEY